MGPINGTLLDNGRRGVWCQLEGMPRSARAIVGGDACHVLNRANGGLRLVRSADQWRWGSLPCRLHGTPEDRSLLAESPLPLGRNWLAHVNKPQTMAELASKQSPKKSPTNGSCQNVGEVGLRPHFIGSSPAGGQFDSHGCSARRAVVHNDRTAVVGYDAPALTETEAEAAAGFAAGIERLEDVGTNLDRNARAVVTNGDRGVGLCGGHRNVDAARASDRFHRVLHECPHGHR